MKLTTDLHVVPRLRMNGAVPPLPFYAFMSWTGTTLIGHLEGKKQMNNVK
jgi:hypothetical protein